MCGVEFEAEPFVHLGHADGAYSNVNGVELAVAESSLALSSSRAMRTMLRM